MLSLSSYPLFVYFFSWFMATSFLVFFKFGFFNWFVLSFFFVVYLWFKDIALEGLSGFHNFLVQDGFKLSMVLFVFSEFMFFFGVFWFFFDSSLSSDSDVVNLWPPLGLDLANPFGVPLLNSCILLSSGVTVTWCHYCLLCNTEALSSVLFTLSLSVFFLSIQFFEYLDSDFSLSDSVLGSVFFFSTGFHGLHVFFGSLFLFCGSIRLWLNHFSLDHHLSLEFGIVYWHFVDVVWLFLFIFVYWWSF